MNVMIGFWGKKGPVSRLLLQAVETASKIPEWNTSITASRQNEYFAELIRFEDALAAIDTFSSPVGVLSNAWKIIPAQRQLFRETTNRKIDVFLELMPHVWSPFLAASVQRAGARYVTIAHDAEPHPGDPTARMKPLLDLALRRADRIIVLSDSVERILKRNEPSLESRIRRAFLPDIDYGVTIRKNAPYKDTLRLLFFGRIAQYKGLDIFVEAAERLHDARLPVEFGVFGAGPLGSSAARLQAIGAEVVNRWISDEELRDVLGRYDVVVVSHIEASQSAVVATAFGAGLPVIATPVGGLREQVRHGYDGLISSDATGHALADTIRNLLSDRELLSKIKNNASGTRTDYSMENFLRKCVAAAGD